MYLFNKTKTKTNLFSKVFSSKLNEDMMMLMANDVNRCLHSMDMIVEYIRFCYHDSYITSNSKQMNKYCAMLIRFEKCNQPEVTNYCLECISKILSECISKPYHIKSVDMALCFMKSNHQSVVDLCNTLMNNSLGTHVRGVSF